MADNHEVIVVDEAEENRKAKKENRKLKHKEKGALYVVPIREYADDAELYQSRYDQKSRTAYWNHLNNNPRKHIKKTGESWIDVSQRNNFEAEIVKYRKHARRVLAFAATSYWDYLYIYLLGLMLVLAVMFYDDWLQAYVRIPFNLLAVPPFFMFLTQLIPTISAVYVSSRYNDLVKLVARQTFGHWVSKKAGVGVISVFSCVFCILCSVFCVLCSVIMFGISIYLYTRLVLFSNTSSAVGI